ncbi:MAG: hypothetical protein RLZZ347_560 [Candidatus Parcubacteria bacterium]|jgi:hypothetical protein
MKPEHSKLKYPPIMVQLFGPMLSLKGSATLLFGGGAFCLLLAFLERWLKTH